MTIRILGWLAVFVFTGVAYAQQGAEGGVASGSSNSNGGIVTLYANDPLGQSLCFYDGRGGSIIQEGELRNRCSHLNFSSYSADSFAVGVQGGERGVILALGTPRDLQARFGYRETVGLGQGFASLSVRDGQVYILKDRSPRSLQPLAGAEALFTDAKSSHTAPVKKGHIYILRITGTQEKRDVLAKLVVVSHVPNESVTFRWQTIDTDPSGSGD